MQTDFQTLLSDAQGKKPESASNDSPPDSTPPADSNSTLLTFLQNILNNLDDSTPVATAVGGIISTS